MSEYKLVPVESLIQWREAFAEELSAYDIDPPIHHVKASYDEISSMLDAAPEVQTEPVAYMHCPSVAMEAKVRPVLSFEKYEGDYASGIYAERIPLYTHPQPAKQPLTEEQIAAVVDRVKADVEGEQ